MSAVLSRLGSDHESSWGEIFDPETYRHVMTIYSVEVAPIGAQHGITTSARQDELRFTLEERFSEFQAADDSTLPRRTLFSTPSNYRMARLMSMIGK